MTSITKLGLSLFTIGTVAGASYAGITYFNEKNKNLQLTKKEITIAKLIKDKYDYIMLNVDGENDNLEWKNIWTKYKVVNGTKAKGEDELQLSGWPTTQDKDLIQEIKEKCKELSKDVSNSIESELYKKVTKHCTRGVTIKEQAEKDSLTIANVDSGDESFWSQKESKKTILDKELKAIGITSGTIDVATIKQSCKTVKDKNKQEQNYENIYEAFKKICTKGKS